MGNNQSNLAMKKSLSKQIKIFEELGNKRIDEIHNLSEQIDFYSLT